MHTPFIGYRLTFTVSWLACVIGSRPRRINVKIGTQSTLPHLMDENPLSGRATTDITQADKAKLVGIFFCNGAQV